MPWRRFMGLDSLILAIVLVIAAMVLAAVGLLLMYRAGRAASPPPPANDPTNMMILMQTMRDVLREQKDLAQQLHESVDRRVRDMRRLLEEVQEGHQHLAANQKQLSDALEQLRDRADEVGLSVAPAVQPPQETEPAIAPPAQPTPPDIIDTWTGLDFGDLAPSPDAVAREATKTLPPGQPTAPNAAFSMPAPEGPEDAEAARDAFRKLLNLDLSGPPLSEPLPPLASNSGKTGSNGHRAVTPLQKRVYEYSDAGMSVQQIARELGIGKGEIRLMLSLRAEKDSG